MKKLFKKRHASDVAPQGRITNDTVAEHREQILAGGRKFKYPVQYTRHRLVFNIIIIATTIVAVFFAISWWQLYRAQNSSSFFYSVTRIAPVPVASVDGAWVRYSDYLMLYRANEHFLRENGQLIQSANDSSRQLDYYRRQALNQAQANTYAEKLADELNISVSEAEINDIVQRSLQTSNGSISQELYDASALETLGYTRDEYRLVMKQLLLRQKVAYEIDKQASDTINQLKGQVKADSDFAKVAEAVGSGVLASGSGGFVKKTNPDPGLAQAAVKLKVGEISDVIKSTNGDGYYIIRLDDIRQDELSYSYLKVPLTEFDRRVETLRKEGKMREFIMIPDVSTEVE